MKAELKRAAYARDKSGKIIWRGEVGGECYNARKGYWSLFQLSDHLSRRVPGIAWAGYGEAPED